MSILEALREGDGTRFMSRCSRISFKIRFSK